VQPQTNHSYQGETYTLQETLLRSTSYWATRLINSAAGNPFYPTREDLIQDAWVKLLQAYAKVEKIWNHPDPANGGFRGISKYVSAVVHNVAIDSKRYREAKCRAPEVFALSLATPTTIDSGGEGVNEDTGTLADTISDETAQPQAFRLEDLEVEMTADEFSILSETINGATITDIAEERGESRSHVGRIAVSAKAKAEQWIEWLRQCSYDEARQHISYWVAKKACLRPDRIAKHNVEGWNDSLIVPFHDPASEWHPRITKQPYVRTKIDCYNAACKHGLAIGADNLALPAARRHEAVRFLPARTTRANTLCAGCAKANVLVFSAKPNVTTFFIEERPSQHLEESMQHQQASEIIKQHHIPRSTVARLSGMYLSDLSGWLNGRTDLAQDKIERVTQTITDIAKVVQVMPMKIDLADCDNVRKLIVAVVDAELQISLFDETTDAAPNTEMDLNALRLRAVEK
jgi:DNA-directed RNA polymerase specialized sigma24 family protein